MRSRMHLLPNCRAVNGGGPTDDISHAMMLAIAWLGLVHKQVSQFLVRRATLRLGNIV